MKGYFYDKKGHAKSNCCRMHGWFLACGSDGRKGVDCNMLDDFYLKMQNSFLLNLKINVICAMKTR